MNALEAFFAADQARTEARQAVESFRATHGLEYGKKSTPEIDNQYFELLSLYGKAQNAYAKAAANLPE